MTIEESAGVGQGPRSRRAARRLAPEDAASRITAFVYGNILVLAALLAVEPDDLLGWTGIVYVLGTGISTFLAHVVAESVGSSVRRERGESDEVGWQNFRHHVRDATPIASSAFTPALLLAGALVGYLDPTIALLLAIIVTVLRLGGLGLVVGRLRGERASFRTFLAGGLLAVVCIGVAVLKWWLTH